MIKNTQRKELDNRPSISRGLVLIAERTGSPPRDMAFNGQLSSPPLRSRCPGCRDRGRPIVDGVPDESARCVLEAELREPIRST
jgi:hypothetical protein